MGKANQRRIDTIFERKKDYRNEVEEELNQNNNHHTIKMNISQMNHLGFKVTNYCSET
jgi:hypothetical protein